MTEPFVVPADVFREALKAARARSKWAVLAERGGNQTAAQHHRKHRDDYLKTARTYREEMNRG